MTDVRGGEKKEGIVGIGVIRVGRIVEDGKSGMLQHWDGHL
jgi:hypothetical protein